MKNLTESSNSFHHQQDNVMLLEQHAIVRKRPAGSLAIV